MRRVATALALAAALWTLSAERSAGQAKVEGVVGELDIVAEGFLNPDARGVVWSSGPIERHEAGFLRLRFDQIRDEPGDAYALRILSASEDPLQEIDQEEFSARSEYWSEVFLTDEVYVEVVATAGAAPRGLRFRIAEMSFEWKSAAALSISGRNDLEHLERLGRNRRYTPELSARIERKARSVAWFVFTRGRDTLSCSGFLIDGRHLLTNRHCVRNVKCKNAVAIFDYRELNEKASLGPHFRCKAVHPSSSHDAAIVELEGDPGQAGFEALEISPEGAAELGQGDLVIIQHPGGEPKQVSRVQCRVTTTPDREGLFGHRCDTAEGSSGSPVLAAGSLRVVGLHRLGFSREGRWIDENRAVHTSALGDFIRRITDARGSG